MSKIIWRTVKWDDDEFKDEIKTYKMIGHIKTFNKHIGKNYCKGCGLVYLNNEPSQRAVKKGCLWYLVLDRRT